ncbi:MAG: hypothetical protein KJ634_07615 [Gammaproteobacteria bacterium]|nr:hypothetical protein [Gammaproteobacteria bacterium]MBU1415476.1 hypothetical protein [Gammaproteobacteria bacterium]
MGILNRIFGRDLGQTGSDRAEKASSNDWPSSLKVSGQRLAWGTGHRWTVDLSEFSAGDFQLILHGGPISVPQGPDRSVFDRLEEDVLRKIRSAPAFGGVSNQDAKYLTGMARLKIALSMAVMGDMDLQTCLLLVQQ